MPDPISSLPYLSAENGIGGKTGNDPEDFIVEEIPLDGKALEVGKPVSRNVSEGEYTVFALRKRLWSTQDAIAAIANLVGTQVKSFSAAGNKDRNAITTQLVSVWKVDPFNIRSLNLKDIEILGCWQSKEPIEIGDLLGNRFTIRIEGYIDLDNGKKMLKKTKDMVPNYFGPQRFGSRGNNYVVGKLLVQGNFSEAVAEFIYGQTENEDREAINARLAVKEEGITERTLALFPKRLRHEYVIMKHLNLHPEDYIGAFKELSRNLQMMLVQSYQSHLFNKMLGERITNKELNALEGETECGFNSYGFVDPATKGNDVALGRIIGYDTVPNEAEENVLWKEGIGVANFRIRAIPELSMKGTYRPLLMNVKDYGARIEKNDNSCIVCFELPKGGYATIALRELIDNKRR